MPAQYYTLIGGNLIYSFKDANGAGADVIRTTVPTLAFAGRPGTNRCVFGISLDASVAAQRSLLARILLPTWMHPFALSDTPSDYDNNALWPSVGFTLESAPASLGAVPIAAPGPVEVVTIDGVTRYTVQVAIAVTATSGTIAGQVDVDFGYTPAN